MKTLVWEGPRCLWRFSRQRRDLHTEDIQGQDFLIAISLRNPQFSNNWIRSAVIDILSLNGTIKLCLVDVPYFERVFAGSATPIERHRAIEILEQQCREQVRRIRRIASAFKGRVTCYNWRSIEGVTPRRLLAELESSFSRSAAVHDCLIEQVRSNIPNLQDDWELEAATVFLRHEFPVLTFMYYHLFVDTIDVYPGPQAEFFWKLERGDFSAELPIATKMASTGNGLLYADVSLHR
jgi:hypothetical protein